MRKKENFDIMEYNHQKYDEFIADIINKRGQWNIPEDEYKEIHHIVPICCGGEPRYITKGKQKHTNLIWLYPREHFIAHKILAEENQDNYKLVHAYTMMAFVKGKGQDRYELSPEEYEQAKIAISIAVKNRPKEIKEKMRENYRKTWNKKTEEEKKKIWEAQQKTRDSKTDQEKQEIMEKRRKTFSSKSAEEKQKIWDKRAITIQNKSDEEKEALREKKKEIWANRTEEEKEKISQKLKEAAKNMPLAKKQEKIRKTLETRAKRTDEEKQKSLEKYRKTLSNRTEEEKVKVKQKVLDSCWNNKTEEEKRAIIEKRETTKKNKTLEEKKRIAEQIKSSKIKNGTWRSGGKPRKVENITTGEIFDYVKDAYTTYPMKFDTLRNAILQNKPDKYGNYWRYLDE